MKEEWASPWEIITRNYKYLVADRRRLFIMGVYFLYIYLFTKRFYLVLRYFKHIIQKYVVGFIRLMKDGKKSSIF